jgi:nucleotide-binding universal stress UspA family protein
LAQVNANLSLSQKTIDMTRILVPVDFSKASVNAAEYAMQMAANLEKAELILFHVYAPSGIGSDGSPSNLAEGQKSRENAAQLLEEMQVKLFEIATVPTDFRYGDGEFLEGMQILLQKESFDWIVMGLSPASGVEERLVGSSVFDVIDKHNLPVIIVGEEMKYKPIKKMALAVELSKVHEVVPYGRIKMMLDYFNPELHIVYANEEDAAILSEAQLEEKQKLVKMFEANNPTFTQLHVYNFVDSINKFVHQQNIDLMIVMPRKLSIWQKLFGYSHTRKLAYHGITPVMAIHD